MKFFNLFTFTVILASTSAVAGKAPTNQELRIGQTQEFENLNPIISTMSATTYIGAMVLRNSPTVINEKNEWVPLLFDTIPTAKNGRMKIITENGVKKVQAKWTIRKEAVWGDGTPITAEDVKFSWEVGKHPNVSVGEKQVYTQVEKMEMDPKDPKTLTFTYDKLRWDFYMMGTFAVLPKHLEESVFNKYKDQKEGYDKNSKYNTEPTLPGLYNGPYRVKDIKLGSHVELMPNEKWYGARPKIQKIIIKLIPNSATLEANVLSGEVHVTNQQGMSFDQAVAFEKKVQTDHLPFKVLFKEGLVYEHIDLNLENEFLADQSVRKALRYSIDLKALCKAFFDGKQRPALHLVNPIDPWFTDADTYVSKYDYNPKKAIELLKLAGFSEGTDKYFHKNGKKLSLAFQTTAGNKIRENVQIYIKDQLKKIGVEVTIKNEPARVFFGETMNKRKFGAMAMFAWVSSPENSPRSTLGSANIPAEKNGWSGQNYMSWKSAKVDQALDRLDIELDPSKRKVIIGEILKEYTNEVPVLPLFYRAQIATVPENLVGMSVTSHQFQESFHVEKWELR